jgi:hypothetical protein
LLFGFSGGVQNRVAGGGTAVGVHRVIIKYAIGPAPMSRPRWIQLSYYSGDTQKRVVALRASSFPPRLKTRETSRLLPQRGPQVSPQSQRYIWIGHLDRELDTRTATAGLHKKTHRLLRHTLSPKASATQTLSHILCFHPSGSHRLERERRGPPFLPIYLQTFSP